jgi:hypothetical protein
MTGPTDSTDWDTYHADMDVTFALGPNDSLDTRIDGRFEHRFNATMNPLAPGYYYDYFRGGVSVSWAHGERFSAALVCRYDNYYYLQGVQTPYFAANGARTDVPYPVIYPAGEVRYMFMPGSTLRLFGGMTPGGRICSNGVCRDVPPFQGALLELVLRI